MKELIEAITSTLDNWGELIEVVLNGISLITIVYGVIISITQAARARRNFRGEHPMHTRFRYLFGGWLVVALEVQLAADIVGTIVSPSTAHLIELGAIAVIRTFLNYFLSKELEEEREAQKEVMENTVEKKKE